MPNLYIYPEYEYSFSGSDTLVQITLKPLLAGFENLYNQVANITLGPTDEPNDVFETDWTALKRQ